MRNFFARFMYGRYGSDKLNGALTGVCLALILVQCFVRSRVISTLAILLLVLVYFRMFSRNIQARYNENQKFLAKTQGIRRWFAGVKQQWKDRKTHRYFRCPTCGKTLRVPKGRGKINISCPQCRTQFIKKT